LDTATPAQGPVGYNPVAPGVDLARNWGLLFHEDAQERGPGSELADYLGIPLTNGARMYGLAWDASRLTASTHFKKQVNSAGWHPTPCLAH
jgi:hypothetical protein